jgi:hypothetical protein
MPGLIKETKKKKQSAIEENGSKMETNENGVDEIDILENGIEKDENDNKKSEIEEENEVKLFALKLGNFSNYFFLKIYEMIFQLIIN